jgi:hypothetical protein
VPPVLAAEKAIKTPFVHPFAVLMVGASGLAAVEAVGVAEVLLEEAALVPPVLVAVTVHV